MEFIYNDGGRSRYFTANDVRDCVTRAIAITSGMDYKQVYDLIRKTTGKTPRNGVNTRTAKFKKMMIDLGYEWHATMGIGTGCTTHLTDGEIPMGRLICNLSGHWTAVIDGINHDIFDPSRGGTRCVYGYWIYRG